MSSYGTFRESRQNAVSTRKFPQRILVLFGKIPEVIFGQPATQSGFGAARPALAALILYALTGARLVAQRRRILRMVSLLLAGVGFGAANLAAQTIFGSAPVGTTTPVTMIVPIPISFIYGPSVFISSVSVFTLGAPSLDYTITNYGLCVPGQDTSLGLSCQVEVSFSPEATGPRYGAVVVQGRDGVLVTSYLLGTGTGPQVAFSPATQSTIDQGLASASGVALDGGGNVYVVSPTGNPPGVVEYTLSSGAYTRSQPISFGAGQGNYPSAMAVDGAGNIFLSDLGTSTVTKWSPSYGGYYIRDISYEHGLYVSGYDATSIAVDGGGSVYFAEPDSSVILEESHEDVSGYDQTTISLNSSVSINAIAIDSSGNFYIGDATNNAVYKETLSGSTYTQSTVVSGLWRLKTVDGAGNVYVVTDSGSLVKEVPSGATYTQSPTLLSGSISSAAVDSSGNIYVADGVETPNGLNIEILKASVTSPPSLSFANTQVGGTSSDSPQTVTVSNNGNANLAFSALSYPTDFPEESGVSTDCKSTTVLAPGAACTLSTIFTPKSSSLNGSTTTLSELVNLTTNAQSGSVGVQVSGTVYNPSAATLSSPAPSTILAGPNVTFSWSAAPGSPTGYALWIGSTGVGSNNLYSTGVHTATSVAVTSLPSNGETIYVRLWTSSNGTLLSNDYTYTTATLAAITSPAAQSTLAGPNVTFSWSSATGSPAGYAIWIGSTGAGSNNLYSTGVHNTASAAVTGLPTTGQTLYVRLWTSYGGILAFTDYIYVAASRAAFISPAAGSTLAGPGVTFSWSTATGSPSGYAIWIGSTGAGSNNLYSTGVHTTTSAAVAGLPTNGGTIYVRLWTSYGGTLTSTDYTYTAAKQAAMTSPAPSSTLSGANVTFTWSPATGSPAGFAIWIGSTGTGSNNLYSTGIHTTTSASVTGLPTNGGEIYVRLWTSYGGTLVFTDYTYTAQ